MKPYLRMQLLTLAAIGYIVILCGCEEKASRKKLPDFTDIAGWEEMPLARKDAQSFYVADTCIAFSSRLENFLLFAIHDPAQDSTVLSMAESYEPFVSVLIEQWQKQHYKGILIDLRGNENDYGKTELIAERNTSDHSSVKIPVVILWDKQSNYRADYFTKAIISFPEIKCNLISDSRKQEGVGRNDCFSPSLPGFEQP